MKILLIFLFSSLAIAVCAQKNPIKISGTIYSSENNKPLNSATISVVNLYISTVTNENGRYEIFLPEGTHELVAFSHGYEIGRRAVQVVKGKELTQNFKLNLLHQTLSEVTVTAKTPIQTVKESAYNVSVIDASAFKKTNMNAAAALDKISGVKVRVDGGVGSNASFSLNGFSGRHIKFFLDGVPMDGMGAAMNLTNLPISIVERIEVYKGVVPVQFGADALGGVINIVTSKKNQNRLDVSFAAGSFNTVKSHVNVSHVFRNGIAIQANIFQNYSKNNYRVYIEPEYSNSPGKWARRFNDRFKSETAIVRLGVIDKPFADKLLAGFTYGKGHKGIQHGAQMSKVFGKRHQRFETILPSLEYAKRDLFLEGLDADLNANFNLGYTQNIDTAAYQYFWHEPRREKPTSGESGGGASMSKLYNNNGVVTINISYKYNETHQFFVNNVFSTFNRKTVDPLAISETTNEKRTEDRRISYKDILGVSYKYAPTEAINISLFGKNYFAHHVYGKMKRDTKTLGYGIAGSYSLEDWLLKASYEKTHRLPSATELFGDGGIEWANFELKPEKGNNYNIGISRNHSFDKSNALFFDVSYVYRHISDYIIRNIYGEGSRATMNNHGKVVSSGVNAELRYTYASFFNLGGNISYQSVRNMEKYKTGNVELSTVYKAKMPYVPYLFGNADANIIFSNILKKGNNLSISYNMNYLHSFFYDWGHYGEKSDRSKVPTQLSHDTNISYSMYNNRVNLSLECINITDQKLYDNYRIQKPGRNFMFKVSYSI